ncbi:MAG: DUF805 domain-containing protein [Hyphomicrobium sp.]|uniref:DUF805 domain-containing protein n=1 Tax=Hyphomicrobium sp. TaxID=82 RepID=UPI003D0B1131
MSFVRSLFSAQGRVSRKYYWLFFVGFALYVVLAAAISVALTYVYETFLYVPRYNFQGFELKARMPDLVLFGSLGLLMLIGGIAVLCVMIKRLHDRNISAAWLAGWIALTLATILVISLFDEPFRRSFFWDWWYVGTRYAWDLLVYGTTMMLGGLPTIAMFAIGIYRNITGGPFTQSIFALPVLIPLALYGLWYFREAGLRRGTVGPNTYGPDPLQS